MERHRRRRAVGARLQARHEPEVHAIEMLGVPQHEVGLEVLVELVRLAGEVREPAFESVRPGTAAVRSGAGWRRRRGRCCRPRCPGTAPSASTRARGRDSGSPSPTPRARRRAAAHHRQRRAGRGARRPIERVHRRRHLRQVHAVRAEAHREQDDAEHRRRHHRDVGAELHRAEPQFLPPVQPGDARLAEQDVASAGSR